MEKLAPGSHLNMVGRTGGHFCQPPVPASLPGPAAREEKHGGE